MYAYCTSSHMSKQFKKWPIKYHFGWLSWPAKIHIKYCTLLFNRKKIGENPYVKYMFSFVYMWTNYCYYNSNATSTSTFSASMFRVYNCACVINFHLGKNGVQFEIKPL